MWLIAINHLAVLVETLPSVLYSPLPVFSTSVEEERRCTIKSNAIYPEGVHFFSKAEVNVRPFECEPGGKLVRLLYLSSTGCELN